jgi:mono/diheme cytochrome c family protein
MQIRLLVIAAIVAVATPFVMNGQGDRTKIYADKCASCHGNDGSGNTTRGRAMKVPDLRSPEIAKKSNEDIIGAFSKPAAHRGLQKQLGDANLKLVVMHLRTFTK